MSRHLKFARAAIVALLACSALLVSAAADDEINLDDDFLTQGEYVGNVTFGGGRWETVGVQVVALGDGKFSAVIHGRGLPGANWDGRTRIELSGEQSDEGLSLTDGTHHVALTGDGTGKIWVAAEGAKSEPVKGNVWKVQRTSPTLGTAPTYGATVLFDGTDPDNVVNRFVRERQPDERAEVTDDGLLKVGALTEMPVGDFYLHLEFRTPYQPGDRGQKRGNSGLYIQKRYELQILDSFGLEGKENECGGLYTRRRPDVNMCYPPLSWQTYDVYFNAARFDTGGSKLADARLTVIHNGILVHDDIEVPGKTGAGQPEGPEPLQIRLQDHGNPVHFRNIWFAARDEYVWGPIHGQPPQFPGYGYGGGGRRLPWPLTPGLPPWPETSSY